MRLFLAACALLVVSSTASASFPVQRYWIWSFDNQRGHCSQSSPGVCRTFTDPWSACTDLGNYPGIVNPPTNGQMWNFQILHTGPLDDIIRDSWRCSAQATPSCVFGCVVGFALQVTTQPVLPPAGGSCNATTCTCNGGANQAQNACSGGQNNGSCTPTGCQANPVNPASGNKVQQLLLYRGPNGFELALSYNVYDQYLQRFGRNWRDSFSRSILLENGQAIAFRADGKSLVFTSSGGSWVADAATADRLVQTTSPAGWQLTTANGDEIETYDSAGKLLSIRSRAGLVQTLTYSDGTTGPNGSVVLDANGNSMGFPLAAGNLVRATDHFGRVISFGYDGQLRVVKVTDPAGGIYHFAYGAATKLSTVTFPDSKVVSYLYNEPANTGGADLADALTGIVDENGSRFATYQYDAQYRALSSEHAGGVGRYQFSYSTGSTTLTSPLNSVSTYAIQNVVGKLGTGGISGAICTTCGPLAQTFDANGNAASRTDWNGNVTTYTYDLARNLETSRTEASGTPQSRTITSEWHATFRLPLRIAEPLRITSFTYDASGNMLTRSVQATTDASGAAGFSATTSGSPRAWTYTYNANGKVLTIDGPRTDLPDVTTYTYYANNDATPGKRGDVATITNAAGHVTQITSYNAHGQPLTIVDPNGLTTTMAYDTRQRLTSRTVGTEVTSYEYDFVGQLTKVTLPDSSFLTYSYDAAHRLTGMADNLGNSVAYTLDVMGNRTQEQVKDPGNTLVQTRSRVYDSLNRLFRELGATSQTTEYGYDNQGNVLTVKDPLNHTTTNQYDALNRLKQVTDPALGVTLYGYNGLDALTQVTDPRSLVTGYTVDGLGNLTQQASPDTGTTASTYDAAGNLLTQTDAKSQTTTYAYDALNRVTQITFHDGAKQVYAYDLGTNGVGRLSSITEKNPADAVTAMLTYAYDQHGRVTSETRGASVVSYQYDSFGRLSGLTYPSGRTVTYSFDSLGRVSAIDTTQGAQTQSVVSSVAYHPFGGVKSWTLGNGQVYTRSIDLDGRIASYTLGATTYAIGYDDASRIVFISDTGVPANSNTYGYDSLDRLTQAVTPSTPYAYSYDAVGNRLSRTVGSGTEGLSYSSTSNRIAALTPITGPTRTFGFDSNGSTVNDGVNQFVYDTRGRMVQATSAIGATSYQVNALGQRIRKTNALGDTVFHYDTKGRLIAESDPGGTVKREIFYLGDIPVGVFQ